jgi:hypothetical protein
MKVNITKEQASYLLTAIDWAVGDGLHPPNKKEAQIISSLNHIAGKPNIWKGL